MFMPVLLVFPMSCFYTYLGIGSRRSVAWEIFRDNALEGETMGWPGRIITSVWSHTGVCSYSCPAAGSPSSVKSPSRNLSKEAPKAPFTAWMVS